MFKMIVKILFAFSIFIFAVSGCRNSDQMDGQLLKYQEQLLINPKDCLARGQVARIYQEKQKLKSAISHFEKVVEYCPDDFTSRFQLGISFLLTGQREIGLDHMRIAIEEAENQGKVSHAQALREEYASWKSK